MVNVTVIICTHNPRLDYLAEVLAALKQQTLARNEWELLIVDNASQQPLELDLSWHPSARVIREDELGLTPARLRGIRESAAKLLVFVDDDNVLDPDYLQQALRLSREWPMLGAWGGQIRPRFATPPPEWTRPYWSLLAIREFDTNKWSNLASHWEALPCGAGVCIRADVARVYCDKVEGNPVRRGLGHKGSALLSGEDFDMAVTACDLGLGIGQFTALNVTHLIPAFRLSEDYLLRLMDGSTFSKVVYKSLREEVPPTSTLRRWYSSLCAWRLPPKARRLRLAEIRARARAEKACGICGRFTFLFSAPVHAEQALKQTQRRD